MNRIPADINDKVIAAFQAEHKEQLEGIRAILAAMDCERQGDGANGMDEAFRLAHSLKGGARVCGLHPVETMAHRLENLFERVRAGQLRLDTDTAKAVALGLDAIEDWMAALQRGEQPGESRDALTVVDRLLGNRSADAPYETIAGSDFTHQLIQAFCSECTQDVASLRQFTAALHDGDSPPADELEEAFRLSQNLRGAARAAEIKSVEYESRSLEDLLAGLRSGTVTVDAATRKQLKQHLDSIDREVSRLAGGERVNLAQMSRSREVLPANVGPRPGTMATESVETEFVTPATAVRSLDTVRISTESLDRLLKSSQGLVADSIHQDQMTNALDDVHRLVNQMQRDRESIRRVAASAIHRLAAMPEFERFASYFETIDRNIQSLALHARVLCDVQKRNSWQLRSRVRRIHDDVRQARMVPAEVVFLGLRKLVRDLAKEEHRQIDFRVTGFDVRADRMVFQSLKDPLIHMLRNCIVHGIEPPDERRNAGKPEVGRIELRIETIGNRLIVDLEDDGRGLDGNGILQRAVERGMIGASEAADHSTEEIAGIIFQAGFTTLDEVNEIAGRGMGLSVVRDAVMRLQGEIEICRKETAGTKFRISIPLSVSTHRLLLVSSDEQTYAIPLRGIARLLRVKTDELDTIEGRPVVTFQGRPVPVVSLSSALGVPDSSLKVNGGVLTLAVLKSSSRRLAVGVDAFLAEKDLLIQDLDGTAVNNRYLGAVLLDEGNVALVLNTSELLTRVRPAKEKIVVDSAVSLADTRKRRVLVVDDSFTTRTLEKSILEANGYHVGVAVDGVEAFNRLKTEHYDLVISDVEMPRMDGFRLLEEIKRHEGLSSTPVILVTSKSRREDQIRGLDLGAEAYIVKQKFDHHSLLDTIRQVVDQ